MSLLGSYHDRNWGFDRILTVWPAKVQNRKLSAIGCNILYNNLFQVINLPNFGSESLLFSQKTFKILKSLTTLMII